MDGYGTTPPTPRTGPGSGGDAARSRWRRFLAEDPTDGTRLAIPSSAGVIRREGRDILVPPDITHTDRVRVWRSAQRWLTHTTERVNAVGVVFVVCFGLLWLFLVLQPNIDLVARAVMLLLGAPAVGHVAWQVRRHVNGQRDDAEVRPQVIIPGQDLHEKDRRAMREVVDAVLLVACSRAQRDGQLGDGVALLGGEQWRIANALVQLAAARRLLGETGGGLPEHAAAVRTAEAAIARRIQAVHRYAEAVQRVDQMLLAVDAAVQSETIHHRVRDAIAALGDDQGLVDLVSDAGTAEAGVRAALDALRDEAESLRAMSTAPTTP
ncbi:hypothetical protein [Actinopolymorpha sp. B9G3]|uniref:hypothetical protein n=1 Tax=Actinopolymorpha sp. B9G3 TaxID=3158970 RepID=UPI0032D966AB